MCRRWFIRFMTLLIASLMVLAWPAVVRGEEIADPYPGTWRIMLTPDDATEREGARAFADAMVFEEGTLLTEALAGYGFEPGQYTRPEDKPCSFTAKLTSGKKGTLEFTGTAVGAALRGMMVWTKADGSVWRFSYSGTRL